ncbi:M28 family metallopeptidase [Haloimpatiens sp. FM7330]|uniref:M28 family metallopeptidase n=1 Tax=Haloimpatiens sp. FM7330 TaxID=3298610 RepID=UPI003630E444
MKKRGKLIFNILTIILSISFIFSFKNYVCISPFNTKNVKENIDYIASNRFKGRLPGTLENKLAATYVKNQFKEIGLLPVENNYFETFTIKYPKRITNNSPYLNVLDKNNKLIHNFKYGKDFREDMINFKKNSIFFNKTNSQFASNNFLKINDGKDVFLFYVPENNKINFRSSFIANYPTSMGIMITQNTFNKLQQYTKSGYSISCYIPFEVKQTSVNNVLGKIEGTNSNLPPVIVSAHFDHVGCDLCGNIYNGALDNASGTSFIIEMAKYLKSFGKPKRDIIFVAFNAEEFGCLGSENFVKKHEKYLKGAKVFNYDMVGGNTSSPLCIMGGKNDTSKTPFLRSISTTCTNAHIYFNYLFQDSSDHKSFRKYNIDAVTFCDNDLSKIHTPNDKAEFIDTTSINRCFKVSSKEIVKYCFGKNPFIIHYKIIMIISISGVIALLILRKTNK